MDSALCWIAAAVSLLMVAGTLVGFSPRAHWLVRGWDFPRVQIVAVMLVSGGLYVLTCFDGDAWDWALAGAVSAALLWQLWMILPYTPLKQPAVLGPTKPQQARSLRLVISNVQMENTAFERWRSVVTQPDPDIIFALEVDQTWVEATSGLEADYPHRLSLPQENHYGMLLLSRLELSDTRVRHMVQPNVPSIWTKVKLGDGTRVRFIGLHPRPPEPRKGQPTSPRDAELVLVGREVERDSRATIVAGDMNDVAWSSTTNLFCRISGLLDPRIGRGMYNTFNAKNPLVRFPLDHVFHSDEFRLCDLRRLAYVSSDHFPILIELSYEPSEQDGQSAPHRESEDRTRAEEAVERQIHGEREGEVRGHLDGADD